MNPIEYRYSIDYQNKDDEFVGAVSVEPDWEPAIECARFQAIRAGANGGEGEGNEHGSGWVEPIWHPEHSAPVISAARIHAGGATGEQIKDQSSFFRRLAREGSAQMVDKGQLEEGEHFRFRVCAYPIQVGEPLDAGMRFDSVDEPLPVQARDVRELGAATLQRAADHDADDLRVLFPRQVLDEVRTAAADAGEVEIGGFLLGQLDRAPGARDLVLEICAQVPALHTDATSASLTFTPDSWAAARAAMDLRGREELLAGWWHFHPDFCRKCPDTRRQQCLLGRPFFSTTDIHLHRTAFPRAYQIGLLASDHGDESLELSLYGWRHGAVEPRSFEVFGA